MLWKRLKMNNLQSFFTDKAYLQGKILTFIRFVSCANNLYKRKSICSFICSLMNKNKLHIKCMPKISFFCCLEVPENFVWWEAGWWWVDESKFSDRQFNIIVTNKSKIFALKLQQQQKQG